MRNKKRLHRKKRIRATLIGSAKRPRLCIFRSLRNITVQIIDDEKGKTIFAGSLKDIDKSGKIKNNIQGASALGKLIAQKCKDNKIKECVFDRSGYKYHGKIKALAEEARKNGLKL